MQSYRGKKNILVGNPCNIEVQVVLVNVICKRLVSHSGHTKGNQAVSYVRDEDWQVDAVEKGKSTTKGMADDGNGFESTVGDGSFDSKMHVCRSPTIPVRKQM